MKSRIFFWSITSALAGFLFGFDTVVISGAEKTIQALWGLSPAMHGLAMGAALWGTVLGSFLGSWPTDRFGRKATLLWIGVLFLVGSLWSATANAVWPFMIARFIGGHAIGVSTVAAPLYISEISPPDKRGRLAGMFQFNIVFGILVAFLSNALLAGVGDNAWRWMLGVAAFPSAIYALCCFAIPESPRWLLTIGGQREQGLKVLRMIEPKATEAQITAEAAAITASAEVKTGASVKFWTMELRVPIMLAFLIAFFNQMSGINAILYYLNDIFKSAGFDKVSSDQQAVAIGATNLLVTMVAMSVIDRLGRKKLLLTGAAGTAVCLAGVAVVFATGQGEQFLVWLLIGFIGFFAFSQGAVIWVYLSEVFPNLVRAKGQSLGSFTHWIMNAIIAFTFPLVAHVSRPAPFVLFAAMTVVQFFVVWTLFPETAGITLEDMQEKMES